jgi:hypothetical protein
MSVHQPDAISGGRPLILLLRFDGEYHGTGRKPSNWMRMQLYMMGWFNRYGNTGAPPPR